MGKIIITIILVNIEITIIFLFVHMLYLFSMSLPKKTLLQNFVISPLKNTKNGQKENLQS